MARKNKTPLNKKSVFKREICPEGTRWDPFTNQCVLDTSSPEDDPNYESSSLVEVPDLSDDDIKKYGDIWITLSDPEKEAMAEKYGKTKEEVDEMLDQYNQSSSTNTQDDNSSQETTDDNLNIDDDLNTGDDLNIDDDLGGGTDKKSTSTEDIFDDSFMFKTDIALGAGANLMGPKTVNQKAVNDYLAQIEKPASGSVYDKLAARYRSQGEGAVLRTQKNLENLFQPTITLIKEREALAKSRFTLMKNQMPEFDESTIFGDLSGNPMPILDHVQGISGSVKEDLRMLSRLNPDDERYDEIRKRVEKNQDTIVNFDKINQQLLKIRNAGTDESQWSNGMDDTTKAMWRDIYLSNGKNIKLVDGKLVWTDTKGAASYDFGDYKSSGYYFPGATGNSEMFMDLDPDYQTNEELSESNGGVALGLLHHISVVDGVKNKSDLEDDYSSHNVEEIQMMLNNLGYTDDKGKVLEEDGDWGPKSQQAYNKYLKGRDEREKAFLDEHLSEEEKEKYRKTTGVGDTKIVDLSQIGDGPTTIDNIGVKTDMEIQDAVQTLINSDVKMDDPAYERKVKGLIFRLNEVGPEGIKSLIFDGIGTDSDNLFQSSNTDSFIKGVIRNHYGDKLSASEIAEKIDEMKSGDVTKLYRNGKGGTTSLQTQFMEWYKNDIDERVREGKKSKLSATARTGTSGGSSGGGSTGDFSESGMNLTYGTRGKVTSEFSDKTVDGYDLQAGEIGVTASDINSLFASDRELKNYMQYDTEDEKGYNKNYVIGNDNIIRRYDPDTDEWVIADMNKASVREDATADDIRAYNKIMNWAGMQVSAKGSSLDWSEGEADFVDTTRLEHKGYDSIDSGLVSNSNFPGLDDRLLDYDDGGDMATAFNAEYSKYGFWMVDVEDDSAANDTKGKGNAGLGVVRIYFLHPRDGTQNTTEGEAYRITGDPNVEGEGWIDIEHDQGIFQQGEQPDEEARLEAFLEKHYDKDYWETEGRYTEVNGELVKYDPNRASEEVTYE